MGGLRRSVEAHPREQPRLRPRGRPPHQPRGHRAGPHSLRHHRRRCAPNEAAPPLLHNHPDGKAELHREGDDVEVEVVGRVLGDERDGEEAPHVRRERRLFRRGRRRPPDLGPRHVEHHTVGLRGLRDPHPWPRVDPVRGRRGVVAEGGALDLVVGRLEAHGVAGARVLEPRREGEVARERVAPDQQARVGLAHGGVPHRARRGDAWVRAVADREHARLVVVTRLEAEEHARRHGDHVGRAVPPRVPRHIDHPHRWLGAPQHRDAHAGGG
mmetsp:Transcript_34700/g.85375  ORF Transcript_34700/g.85375 Transcript_34700/m.85375 type:complete len:270 (-) Transcript_34700:999-1808(-)